MYFLQLIELYLEKIIIVLIFFRCDIVMRLLMDA